MKPSPFAEKHYPETLLPEELDYYLSKGWYRMGQSVFTTHFLCFAQEFYSALWIRLPLKERTYSKSLRKNFRRNKEKFKVRVSPASITHEKELLYHRYKLNFPGILAPSIKDSLLDGEENNIFSTYEVTVRDGNRLVALSYFDLGRRSAASIMGIYDPEYRQYSLGIFTMLVEIEFCRQAGLSHYYPGYVVPGFQRFDYKLRIGEVEYFDLNRQNWYPYQKLHPKIIPLQRMEERLFNLLKFLLRNDFRAKKKKYPLFEANLFGYWNTEFLDYPVFLQFYPDHPFNEVLIAVYDVWDSQYKIWACSKFEEVHFYFNESFIGNFDRNRFCLDLLVPETLISIGNNPENLLRDIRKYQMLNPIYNLK